MNLEMQWMTLLWMLISGSVLGAVFDGIRIVEGRYRFPKWSIHVLDLLYWIWAALYVFRTLYHSNHGELRFYVFLGLFAGVLIYFWLLSVPAGRFVVMLLKIVDKVYLTIVRLVKILVIGPLKFVFKAARLLLGFLWVMLLFILRMLHPLWKLLRFFLVPLARRLKLPAAWQWTARKVSAIRNRWFRKQ
ncbi:spore cortex biosynthesis protein YabQ [Paenibacillus pinistramenti]|uniref:spore cortex biosynthesis protein YabQ n=1 Tax=Paenibacillus pinistramenti TaxID=1768003 RepID=UPI00110970A1|nr:spore cortex biosynthesis protein YabQ [Paenibacillus pinistramenti]